MKLNNNSYFFHYKTHFQKSDFLPLEIAYHYTFFIKIGDLVKTRNFSEEIFKIRLAVLELSSSKGEKWLKKIVKMIDSGHFEAR